MRYSVGFVSAFLLIVVASAQTTQPAAPDQGDSPQKTMQRFMDLLAQGNVKGAQELTISKPEGNVADKLQRLADGMAGGVITAEVVDGRQDGDMAYLILRIKGLNGKASFEGGPLAKRDGKWLVMMYNPDSDTTEPALREKNTALQRWVSGRIAELRETTTRPTTQPTGEGPEAPAQ